MEKKYRPACEPWWAGRGCSQGMRSSVSVPGCSSPRHRHLHPSSVTDTSHNWQFHQLHSHSISTQVASAYFPSLAVATLIHHQHKLHQFMPLAFAFTFTTVKALYLYVYQCWGPLPLRLPVLRPFTSTFTSAEALYLYVYQCWGPLPLRLPLLRPFTSTFTSVEALYLYVYQCWGQTRAAKCSLTTTANHSFTNNKSLDSHLYKQQISWLPNQIKSNR